MPNQKVFDVGPDQIFNTTRSACNYSYLVYNMCRTCPTMTSSVDLLNHFIPFINSLFIELFPLDQSEGGLSITALPVKQSWEDCLLIGRIHRLCIE